MNTLIITEAMLIIKGETTVQLRISAVLLRKAGRWDVPYASNQERLFPKLGFGNEGIIFANYGALQKAKWSISFELGYGKKPALHGR